MNLDDYYRKHGEGDRDYFDTLSTSALEWGVVPVSSMPGFAGGVAFYKVVDYSDVRHWIKRSIRIVDIHSEECRNAEIAPEDYCWPTKEYPVKAFFYGDGVSYSKRYASAVEALEELELMVGCAPLCCTNDIKGSGYAK